MNVDWKKRYDELTLLDKELIEAIKKVEFISYKIKRHTEESDHLSLRERGKCRFVRLKEEVTIPVEYDYCPERVSWHKQEMMTFQAGTLVEADIHGFIVSVYLDRDGDGYLHFPSSICEVVELNEDEVDWTKIVSQG